MAFLVVWAVLYCICAKAKGAVVFLLSGLVDRSKYSSSPAVVELHLDNIIWA
jgi:hypothetical protein